MSDNVWFRRLNGTFHAFVVWSYDLNTFLLSTRAEMESRETRDDNSPVAFDSKPGGRGVPTVAGSNPAVLIATNSGWKSGGKHRP